MKILQLSLHPPLDPARVATGNQVRDAGIRQALEAAGHQVRARAPMPPDAAEREGGNPGFYASRQELAGLLESGGFDAILVAYWTLLEDLPDTGLPVVLDVIAPRLLEAMYQGSGEVLNESRRMLQRLPRADHFLVGNQRQADFLLPLLLLAGFDCRERTPISIVPISISGEPAAYIRSLYRISLVSAGVDWPWRQSREYLEVVEDYCLRHERFDFVRLNGDYPAESEPEPEGTTAADAGREEVGNGDRGTGGERAPEAGLASYREMQRVLGESHMGLELGRRNTEREFSHSFRLMEYLQCGLPVIVNAWLPLAEQIRRYNAGWLIESPAELPALLDGIGNNPAVLMEKSRGSRRLANRVLNYSQSCRPLLNWLQAPWRPVRGEPLLAREDPAAKPEFAAAPPRRVRLKLMLAQLFKFLLFRARPTRTPDILMVTRADLFPVDHGAAVKIIHTARALSRLDRDVYLCTDSRRHYYRFRQGSMSTHPYPLILSLLAPPRAVGMLRLLLRGFPFSNAFLYFPLTDFSYSLRALYLTGRFPIGAFQAEFPAYVRPCAQARSLFGGRLLLVEHNVEYERIRAQVPELSAKGYRRLKDLELHMCALADAVVAVSENDRSRLIADGIDPERIHAIPHGVDLEAFRDPVVSNVREIYGIPAGRPLLVYHGTYSYPPNLQAMKVMADELLPRLQALGTPVSVLAVGSQPPDYPLHPDIHFTGSVEHLAQVLPAADLAVVPLLEGGGTRMKILDYFAAGIPVISTGKGIEGIEVEHEREALILNDYDAICAAIVRLVEHSGEARQLVEHASCFVNALGWEAIARRYLPLLRRD